MAAAGAVTATGGRPRECCAVRPPGQSPAPARPLVPQPSSCLDPRSDPLRCSCLSSADCVLRSRPWLASSAPRDPSSGPSCRRPPRPEIDPTALRRPRCLPGAPAGAPRSPLPGTFGGPARPAPWSTGPRASASSSGSSRPWAAAAVPVRPKEVSAGRV